MASITLKNVPENLYEKLKAAAEVHKRSINSEIIVCLEKSLLPRRQSAGEILAKAQLIRARATGSRFSLDELNQARRKGRR